MLQDKTKCLLVVTTGAGGADLPSGFLPSNPEDAGGRKTFSGDLSFGASAAAVGCFALAFSSLVFLQAKILEWLLG
jgi:hypothetical protein